MSGRLLSILAGRSGRTRWLTVAALGLVALSVLASALTPAPGPERGQGPPSTRSTHTVYPPPPPRRLRAVSGRELAGARTAAARFLAGYLAFVYGRGSARAIDAATRDLRRQLTRTRAQVTPVERRRRPRVISLTTVAQTPRIVVVTALVEDGGVTTYGLRITVREGPVSWQVSGVDGV